MNTRTLNESLSKTFSEALPNENMEFDDNEVNELSAIGEIKKTIKKTPGVKSETSRINAEKARKKRMEELQKKKLIEEFIRKKTEDVLKKNKSVPVNDMVNNKKINDKNYYDKAELDKYDDSDDSDSSNDVIYVAPVRTKNKKKVNQNEEIETLKKELEELRRVQPAVKNNVLPSDEKNKDLIKNLQRKLINI